MRLGLREADRFADLRQGLHGAGLEQPGHDQPAFLCDHLGDLGAVGQPVPGVLYLFGCGGGRPALIWVGLRGAQSAGAARWTLTCEPAVYVFPVDPPGAVRGALDTLELATSERE